MSAELAHPYVELSKIADITVVSPKGGYCPVDPLSVRLTAATDTLSHSFLEDKEIVWSNTGRIKDFIGKGKVFDVLYCPGGHARESSSQLSAKQDSKSAGLISLAALFDLADDPDLKNLIVEVYEAGKIVAAVCHGVIALKDVKLPNGEYLVSNSAVTGFSNAEEEVAGYTDVCPVLVETEMVRNGGKFEKAEANWAPQVSVARGGRLITGQNPNSAPGIAEAIKKALVGQV